MWKLLCLIFLVPVVLTGCWRPLVTNRHTPTPVRTGTTTVVAGATIPTSAAPAATVAQPEPTAPVDVTDSLPASETATSVLPPVEVASPPIEVTIGVSNTSTLPAEPGQTAIVIVPATRVSVSNNERWRQQELNRQPLSQPQAYTTTGSDLYWYDPVYQQSILLGSFSGTFDVLATFQLRSTGQPALEVLYEVNKRYGLTALSPAIVERITAAGYTNGVIDTYVIVDTTIKPK